MITKPFVDLMTHVRNRQLQPNTCTCFEQLDILATG